MPKYFTSACPGRTPGVSKLLILKLPLQVGANPAEGGDSGAMSGDLGSQALSVA
jgi:hypothetical protein